MTTALAIKYLKMIRIRMLSRKKAMAVFLPDNTWAWYRWN